MFVSLVLLVLADEPLDAARRDVRRLNYVAAVRSLEHAAQSPLSWNDARSWLELRGIVAASTGDSAKAGQTFEQLLTLDPQWALSGRYAPRVTTPFYEARGRAREHGPLKLTFSRVADHQLHFTLTDPLAQAKHVEFEVTEGGGTHRIVLAPAPEITVPFSEGMVTARS